MTNIFILIITAKLAFELVLQGINLTYLKKVSPQSLSPELSNILNPEELTQSIKYTAEKQKVSIIATLIEYCFLLSLILTGIIGNIDEQLVYAFPDNPWIRGLLLFAALSCCSMILDLPLSYYKQFSIETRYGFNKQTPKLFFRDLLLQIVLGSLLGSILLCALFFAIEASPHYWWLLGWAVFWGFQLSIMFIYPRFLAPLFNKFTPLEDGLLKNLLQDLSVRLDFPVKDIFVMDGSKRSGHANAYFTGLGKERRIVLFDTLINQLSPAEVEAVLAHEIGHCKYKHITKQLILFGAISLYGFFVLYQLSTWRELYTLFGVSVPSTATLLLCFSLVVGPVLYFVAPLINMLSRAFEFQADAYAVQAVESSRPLAQGLLKLSKNSKSNPKPHPWFSAFYYSHPPLAERLAAMEKIVIDTTTTA